MLVIVAMVPQIVLLNEEVKALLMVEKMGSVSLGHCTWNDNGVVKENPGGIDVVDGHLMSNVSVDDCDGIGSGFDGWCGTNLMFFAKISMACWLQCDGRSCRMRQ